LILLLSVSVPGIAQRHDPDSGKQEDKQGNLREVIWRDPGDVAALDLVHGMGGKDHAPVPGDTYTFIKEDQTGNSPKFDVEDVRGVRWKVKLGPEAHSETAATRLLWAAGYFVDEDYYLPEIKVAGLPTLRRGEAFISSNGIVHSVRLERRLLDAKKASNWGWFDNSFLGTRELNALRVMMALLNNWDLTEGNNSIDEVNGERRYLVSDVGATFGSTGNHFTHSKSALRDYVGSKFIETVNGDSVDFVMHSRPFFLMIFDIPRYRARTEMERITKHVPRAHAKWLGEQLSRLSAGKSATPSEPPVTHPKKSTAMKRPSRSESRI
jgi:hypothetical protein